MTVLRAIVRLAYVPFMLLGLTSAAYFVVTHAQTAYGYLWLAPLLALAYACAFAAERIAPFFEDWNDHTAHGDTRVNIFHTIAYETSAIQALFMLPVIVWLFPFQGLWPVHWPLWAQVLIAFIWVDFAFTTIHFLSHKFPLLWRLHSVHHGVGRLYGFNGIVRHPLHQSLDLSLGTAPLAIAGMQIDAAVMLGFLISVTLIVQHSNVDARLGPLQRHLSFGRNHHLHHVNWGTEGDCNYGLFLTLWDRLFGTYNETPSRPITSKDMGVDELPNFPKSFIEQLILPFVYKPGSGEPARYRKAAEPTPAQAARRQAMHAAE